jgi:RNA polymerase sigma factor (sigma-70 family)
VRRGIDAKKASDPKGSSVAETLEKTTDADLIAAVRQGDVTAFATLYERHLTSAKRAAACLVRTQAEREDLVAEAFTRVLRILREGRGPNEEFRPYLLVTLRNTAIHSATRGTPVSLYADLPDAYLAEDRGDPVIDRWDAHVAANAFASLPERWRVVLWHTEVENESPAEVATMLGMRPNSVAALAYRAREGLRQAYLRMHVPQPPRPECAQIVKKLAGYVRRNVPMPLSRKISRHLGGCAECRARVEVLTRINSEIAGLLAPVVLGAPLAAAYLHASGSAIATAALAATDSGLATGVLTVKAGVLKAGAAALVAATAVTTTAVAPIGQPDLVPIKVVEGTRASTYVVPGPIHPPIPEFEGKDRPERDRAGLPSPPPATPGPSVVPPTKRTKPPGNGKPTTRGPWSAGHRFPGKPGKGNPAHGKPEKTGQPAKTGKPDKRERTEINEESGKSGNFGQNAGWLSDRWPARSEAKTRQVFRKQIGQFREW